MIETEWNTCRDPRQMLLAFRDNPFRADLTLFGCACCRRVWGLLTDDRLRRGVEVRERYEQGLVTEEELTQAERDARSARADVRASYDRGDLDENAPGSAPGWAAGAASNATYGNYRAAWELAARARACADATDWKKSYEAEKAAQCDLLRSMVPYSQAKEHPQ
jgi:hypothetical protein